MVNQNLRKLIKIHLQEDHPCSSQKEASIMIMISQGRNLKGLHHKEDHSLPGIQIYFMVIVFIVLTLDIRLQIPGIIKRNVQARNAYVAPRNIECYKCHKYGHIVHVCRSMIDTSMKENIDIIYKKVWIRK
jgi:hypothetical protein